MKKFLVFGTVIAFAGALVVGCGTESPEQMFLQFTPQGETGAPHDMKYLVENDAGDGGYYKSQYLPGTLTVKPNSKGYAVDWSLPNSLLGHVDYKFQMTKDGSNLKASNVWANDLINKVLPPSN